MPVEPYIPRRYNRDGTRNVYCKQCHRFVGTNTTSNQFGSVSSCAICLAAEEGVELPPDIIAGLHAVRLPGDGMVVPQFVMQEAERSEAAAKSDPLSKSAEDRLGMRHWLRARTIEKVKSVRERIAKTLGSQALARDKKRPRIFDRPIKDSIDNLEDE